MEIDVRKVETLGSIDGLRLDERIRELLKGVPVDELIRVARMGDLMTYEGIGKRSAEQIMEAVDREKFIYHETRSYRELLWEIGMLDRPKTNEEYEAQIAINDRIIKRINTVLHTLYNRERVFVILKYNLLDAPEKMTMAEIATYLNLTQSRLRV